MSGIYLDISIPAVYAGTIVLAVTAGATAVWIGLRRVLTMVAIGFGALVVATTVVAVMVLFQGDVDVPLMLGYLIASLALLALLGIARLGTPEAAANEPGRPVLQPDQLARVDAIAAVIVAAAEAVVAWRLAEIVPA